LRSRRGAPAGADPRGSPRGRPVDEDVVLQALGADLERDDPGLASLLNGTSRGPAPHVPRPRARRRVAGVLGVLLAALGLLTATLLLPLTAVIGVFVMLLIGGSPLAAAWLCHTADEIRPQRHI
jgi:hypothetical protein